MATAQKLPKLINGVAVDEPVCNHRRHQGDTQHCEIQISHQEPVGRRGTE